MIKNKIFLIDSNIFLRILVRDSQKQYKESLQFVEAIKKGEIKAITSVVVLLEVGWVLQSFYGYRKKEVLIALDSIDKIKRIKLKNDINFNTGINIFEKYNIKLGDAMIASTNVVQKEKAIIVSYDKDFDKLKIKRQDPGEFEGF